MKVLLVIVLITKSLAHDIHGNPPSVVEIKRNDGVMHMSRTKDDQMNTEKRQDSKNEVNGYNKNIVTDNNLTVKIGEPTIGNKITVPDANGLNSGAPCCNGVTCFPCPYPMPMAYPMPVPQVPQIPMVVPAQTFYEPVIHDHPPLHKIKKIIKGRRRKRPRFSDTDTDSSYSSYSSDLSDGYSSIDYYDDAFRVRAP